MKGLLNESQRREIEDRIRALQKDDKPEFGEMTPGTAVCHMIDTLRCGEKNPSSGVPGFKPSFFSTRLGQWFIVASPFPWPKGKIKIPEEFEPLFLKTRPSADFERDKKVLLDEIALFAQEPDRDWPVHPVFGSLSAEYWSRLQHRHIDHHLSQFRR